MSKYQKRVTRDVKNSNYNFSETRGTDPSLMKRSVFNRTNTLSTGFSAGDIVPLYCEEILPNDTVDMNCNFALRMQTLGVSPYDNLEFDIYWFYCPNRLLWDGWKRFCGESQSAWMDKTPVRVPQLINPGFTKKEDGLGTLWDYLGLPLILKSDLNGISAGINALPFRMYGKVFNDWFRDVNFDAEQLVDFTSQDVTYNKSDPVKGGTLLRANKKHDYFTSCLPRPQRSDDVNLLDGLKDSLLNVMAVEDPGIAVNGTEMHALKWRALDNKSLGTSGQYRNLLGRVKQNDPISMEGPVANLDTSYTVTDGVDLSPYNLAVDLSGKDVYSNPGFVDSFTIQNLRKSIAKQQIAEVSARCGNRYENFLLGFFGVEGPDIETGRSELLGVQHTVLNIAEVVQTSGTIEGSTPQGNIAGRSLTNVNEPHAFTKSFMEHGWLMALGVARYNHSYSQGIRRQFMRSILDDYYMPQMANIGDVPVYKYEIYADGLTLVDKDDSSGHPYAVWGYQEYASDYKYVPNSVTGCIRPDVEGGMSVWTWSDKYDSEPTLSAEWLKEDPNNIDRSLVIQTTDKVPQLFGNFIFENNHTRMMPVHSIPGLDRI